MGPTSHSLGMKPVLTCETQLDLRSGWLPSLSLKCPSPLSKVLGTLFSVLIQWRLVARKLHCTCFDGRDDLGHSSQHCGAQFSVN